MKSDRNLLLKGLCVFSGLVSGIGWLIYFIQLFRDFETQQGFWFFLQNPNAITYPLFCVFAIIIAVKSNSNKGTLLFSLFLSSVALNVVIGSIQKFNPEYNSPLLSTITFIITSVAFIKSFQNFPLRITEEHVTANFPRSKRIRWYLKAFLKKQIWLFFTLIILALGFIFPENALMQFSALIVVLVTGLFFLFLNYKISSPSGQNKITWLVWGILSYTFFTILNAVLISSSPEMDKLVSVIISSLRAFSLFLSVTMCLFFFDTFNTGVLIRRTIIDGAMFIVIILLYNTIEHYVLHWINHQLHISNAIASSVLSGFFVLIFSPMHHKLMHLLDSRFKSKKLKMQETKE